MTGGNKPHRAIRFPASFDPLSSQTRDLKDAARAANHRRSQTDATFLGAAAPLSWIDTRRSTPYTAPIKRRNFILFFGLLALLTATWLAWCARPFYLKPTLVYTDPIPPEAKAVVDAWFARNTKFPARPFNFGEYVTYLSDPFNEDIMPPVLGHVTSSDITLSRSGGGFLVQFRLTGTEFGREGKWEGPKIIF